MWGGHCQLENSTERSNLVYNINNIVISSHVKYSKMSIIDTEMKAFPY